MKEKKIQYKQPKNIVKKKNQKQKFSYIFLPTK